MAAMTTLPLFPASIVGSIPRPLVVRELIEKPEWDAADRSAMDAACRFVVALQERAGLDVVNDGEWRRRSYIGVIAELAHGFTLEINPADGRPWTVVTEKLAPKPAGFIAGEAAFVKKIPALLEAENVAYDIDGYRDAPPGLRVWCGATVETADVHRYTHNVALGDRGFTAIYDDRFIPGFRRLTDRLHAAEDDHQHSSKFAARRDHRRETLDDLNHVFAAMLGGIVIQRATARGTDGQDCV